MKKKGKFLKGIISMVLCLAMVLGFMPMTTQAASASAPTVEEYWGEKTGYFANGTDIFIEKGTSGGTAIYYMAGGNKTYMNPNGANGDDLSEIIVYAGDNSSNALTGSPTVTMTGGQVGAICTTKVGNGTISGDVTIIITGDAKVGHIRNAWENCTATYDQIKGKLRVFDAVGVPIYEDQQTKVEGHVKKTGSGWNITGDAVIPTGKTMTIGSGVSVTIPSGATLTNNGTLTNDGIIILEDGLNQLKGNAITGNGKRFLNQPYIAGDSVSSLSVKVDGNEITGDIATVLDGNVFLDVPEGKVYAEVNGNAYYGIFSGSYIPLSVYPGVTEITVTPSQMMVNTSVNLLATGAPSGILSQNYEYVITDAGNTEATISGNVLKAKYGGTVNLSVMATDGYSSYAQPFKITVNQTAVTDISVSLPESIPLSTYTLPEPKVYPENASYKDVVWSVKSGAATISGNSLKPNGNGEVQLTATVKNGIGRGNDFTKDFTITILAPTELDISKGTIEISKTADDKIQIKHSNGVTTQYPKDQIISITGTTNTNTIEVLSGSPKLVLNNCKIDVSHADTGSRIALNIFAGASVDLTLVGTNELIGFFNGIGVQEGASLVIDGGGSLVATATSTNYAGIGGHSKAEYNNTGTITINGGTVNANGTVGIGSRWGGCTVTINGGILNCAGFFAGINNAINITINGGTLNAEANSLSNPAIGAFGWSTTGATIIINGGNIKAMNAEGPSIGSGFAAPESTVQNAAEKDVSLVTLTLSGAQDHTQVTALKDKDGNAIPYGLKDVYTIGDTLYLYLPENVEVTYVVTEEKEYVIKNHTHEWTYVVDGTTITAVCANADCDSDTAGSVTLKAQDAYYTGNAVAATAEGSFTTEATYAITYGDTMTAPSAVGEHTAKLTVSENGVEKQSVTATYEISYLPAPTIPYTISGHQYFDGSTYWMKKGDNVTVYAPDEYSIALVLNGTYGSDVSFAETDDKVIYLKNDAGEMTDGISLANVIGYDDVAPVGEIKVAQGASWKDLINKITFGWFFKNNTTATITATDTDSGVSSIQYYVSDVDLIDDNTLPPNAAIAKLEQEIGGSWNDYNGSINLTVISKSIIYAKITDNVGNVTYLNSNGIVLYADSTLDKSSEVITYGSADDITLTVARNGNGIGKVTCSGPSFAGEKVLEKFAEYTVLSEEIILFGNNLLSKLDVGTYQFTIAYDPLGEEYVDLPENDKPAELTFMLEVEKASVTVPTVANKVYNGNLQTGDIADTDLYTVEKNEGGISTGCYEVVLKLKDATNYKWATTEEAEVTIPFVITAAENSWTTEPSISGWTYGDEAATPTGGAKYGQTVVTYTGTANDGTDYNSQTAPTKAGSYKATFTVAATKDYSGLEKAVDFTIAKKTVDLSGVKWNYTGPIQYDGNAHTVSVIESTLPEGVILGATTDNNNTEVGEYKAAAAISYDDNHVGEGTTVFLDWEIKNDWNPVEYTVSTPNDKGWLKDDFVITPDEGYKISTTDTAAGPWEDALTNTADTQEGSVTFYLKNEETGAISLAKTVTYKLDQTPATGKVSFDESNSWDTFLNAITFELVYDTEVTVTIEAADGLSGVADIEYAAADKAMTLDEVKAISDWTSYNGAFNVPLEDAKQFVYYVRITDNAGNVTYLSTDGAVYDTTAPAITGVEQDKTYYTTQKVTVIDENIQSVFVNGEDSGKDVTLEGNVDKVYTITATDKAGNVTTVTIIMKPISELSQPIDNLTEDNVTIDDAQTVEDVKEAVESVDITNATDAEKAELAGIVDKADELLTVIEEIKEEQNKPDDKDDLNKDDPNKDDPNKDDPNKDDPNKDDPNKDDPNKDDPNKDDPNKDDAVSPNTDDGGNVWLRSVLLVVCAAGVLGASLRRRQKMTIKK